MVVKGEPCATWSSCAAFAFQPLADFGEQRRGAGVELGEDLFVNGRVERHDRGDFGWMIRITSITVMR